MTTMRKEIALVLQSPNGAVNAVVSNCKNSSKRKYIASINLYKYVFGQIKVNLFIIIYQYMKNFITFVTHFHNGRQRCY